MRKDSKSTIGMDVGDRRSHFCVLDDAGDVVERGSFRTTPTGLKKMLAGRAGATVAFETGSHALWIRREVEDAECTALEANPRQVRLIYGGHTKNDRLDAENLARLARLDAELLKPVRARRDQDQRDLAGIKARDVLVRARASMANFVRGVVKPFGVRLPKCGVEVLPKRAPEHIPPVLRATLQPMLETMADLTRKIRAYDKAIEKVCAERHPVTEHLREVRGLGALTALTFVLVIGDPSRFAKSRTVGSYVGLRPKQDQSGDRDVPLGITKAGSPLLRRLLLQCAHYILGRHGEDCDLRRYGERIAARGGKIAKRKATVAVARKLSVLLHRLWVTGEVYEPLRVARQRAEATEEAVAVPA
jgi:transposase